MDLKDLACKHRWQIINKIFKDRLHWITAQKCRKCNLKEQSQYTVDLDNNMRVSCKTMRIYDELSE